MSSAPIIDPLLINIDTLYSRAELAERLEGVIEIETFLERVKPVPRFENAYWGQDILDAIRREATSVEKG